MPPQRWVCWRAAKSTIRRLKCAIIVWSLASLSRCAPIARHVISINIAKWRATLGFASVWKAARLWCKRLQRLNAEPIGYGAASPRVDHCNGETNVQDNVAITRQAWLPSVHAQATLGGGTRVLQRCTPAWRTRRQALGGAIFRQRCLPLARGLRPLLAPLGVFRYPQLNLAPACAGAFLLS